MTGQGKDQEGVVRFDHVGLRYGRGAEVLQDVSFILQRGSFTFLTGASGAGKSSLLRLIYMGMRPSRGRVILFGTDNAQIGRTDLPALRRRIGVVFQDFRLLDHLSALDNVALPLRIAGVSETDIRRYVPDLLNWVGLSDRMHATPPTLSGGQKQRVAIARAVIARPDLLLADEPTGNVDDQIALRLMYLFEELNRRGTTILIASHNAGLIERFPYPCLNLAHGQVHPA